MRLTHTVSGLFRVLYGAGLRVSEAIGLTLADADTRSGTLRIRDSKNGESRTVPVTARLTATLAGYITAAHPAPETSDHVFCNIAPGRPVNQSTVYLRFRGYLADAVFGDRTAPAVTQRSIDEGIGEHTIAAKIEHALAFFGRLVGSAGVEIRTHGTVLYNSIYRFDDEMIISPHVYDKVACHAPALHLRRLSAGDLFTTYEDSFAAVWETAAPWG